ncbi:PREDICTED: testis-expressed sequence 2 protein-like [Nanorana parkeri]|uniref:testis-expressed sequence 2 protein-like n=1 Tax=Nanorana parkeri TaxID=125878 RepID=UPI000854957A|nr:PREDICTED: testis-expressed sequence 2 protein-like [Nanorana parkeri]
MSNSGKLSSASTGSPHSFQGPSQGKILQQTHQGITIQLTKVHSEDNWEELEESDLIFTLDQDEEEALLANPIPNKARAPLYGQPTGKEGTVVDELALAAFECGGDVLLSGETQRCSSPLMPSSPSSKPLINLVKSVSTEIDPKDPSPHKTHPFVNLVKSISTEISRLEPEVSQSKSDSKLNVHLWKQITQPKSKNGDSRTAPSSPSLSPCESKGMFFNVQEVEAKLEDTKRRLSEAMQEPLSMLSKIIGEETSPSPKYRTIPPMFASQESPTSQQRDQGFFDTKNIFPSYGKLEESESLEFMENPRSVPRETPKSCCKYKICSYGDMIQVVELGNDVVLEDQDLLEPATTCQSPHHNNDVPCSALVCVAILAYNFFIWPLPAYISGLIMGITSGFLLGLFMVLLLVPKPSYSSRHKRCLRESSKFQLATQKVQEPCVLQGWMNEIFSYDPETYHPALTHSVFVSLEGTTLKRSYPKSNLPRRSTFGEEIPEVAFVIHETCDLTGAQVFLFPYGLAKKRLWNKKYPICIELCSSEDLNSQEKGDKDGGESPRQDREDSEKIAGDFKAGTLYLFGRTGRGKEEWYQHLLQVIQGSMAGRQDGTRSDSRTGSGPHPLSSSGSLGGTSNSSMESTEDIPYLLKPKDVSGNVKQNILLDYNRYISHFIPTETISPAASPHQSRTSSPTPRRKQFLERALSSSPNVFWVNAYIGRIFWDFLREKYWEDIVANKIQKKLTKIKLPNFMNELTLTGLDMGTSLPQILSTSNPSVNERGLWMDMEVKYSGSLQVTLETKMNLSKLGKESAMEDGGLPKSHREGSMMPRARIFTDSDEESSSAGSSEDEEIPAAETQGTVADRANPNNTDSFTGGNSTSRKILRFVDKIAKSRYFQRATENEYIKRKMEEMSNTPMLLTVEVQELEGTLAVNIPPPPTDRIWYSFRSPPQVEMKVVPKLGEREVTFIHVTEWIEKKLQDEFQKILVMPNMDDLYFPLMQPAVDNARPTQNDPFKPGPL